MKQNNIQLALDILRGRWLLSGGETLLPNALDFLARMPQSGATEVEQPSPMDITIEDSATEGMVFIVPIHGVMTKYDTCKGFGTSSIASEIVEAADDEGTVGIIIDIDSPGGAVNSVAPLVEALKYVRDRGLPVIAHCDACCSAAYWIASQCDAVFMDNELSEVGSIGAYCSFLDNRNKTDGSKVIEIYAMESPDKNREYREALEGRYELCQDSLTEIVSEFHKAVKSGRPGLKTDMGGVLTGATFTARKAIAAGLADGIMTLSDCVENVMIRAEYK